MSSLLWPFPQSSCLQCSAARHPRLLLVLCRVQRKGNEGGIVAARSFSGLPLDWQVRDNERRLRAAVLLDGCKPQEGYKLARYNDPFTLPGFRKNEVLIRLSDYQI